MPVLQETTTRIQSTATYGVYDVTVEGLTAQDTSVDRADLIMRLDVRGEAAVLSYVRHDAYKRISDRYPWVFENSFKLPITGLQEWQLRMALAGELAKGIVIIMNPDRGA